MHHHLLILLGILISILAITESKPTNWNFAVILKVSPDSKSFKLGSPVSIQCSTNDKDLAENLVSWKSSFKHRGVIQNPDTLAFKKFFPIDLGKYTCEIENKMTGVVEQNSITFIRDPSSPSQVTYFIQKFDPESEDEDEAVDAKLKGQAVIEQDKNKELKKEQEAKPVEKIMTTVAPTEEILTTKIIPILTTTAVDTTTTDPTVSTSTVVKTTAAVFETNQVEDEEENKDDEDEGRKNDEAQQPEDRERENENENDVKDKDNEKEGGKEVEDEMRKEIQEKNQASHKVVFISDQNDVKIVQGSIVYAPEGESIDLECLVNNKASNEIIWFKHKDKMRHNYYINQNRLTLFHVTSDDSGYYICEYQDKTTAILVKVVGKDENPSFVRIISDSKKININEGSPFEVYCEAVGDQNMQLWWQKDRVPVEEEFIFEKNTLRIPNVKSSDYGYYECFGRNNRGTFNDYVFLDVKSKQTEEKVPKEMKTIKQVTPAMLVEKTTTLSPLPETTEVPSAENILTVQLEDDNDDDDDFVHTSTVVIESEKEDQNENPQESQNDQTENDAEKENPQESQNDQTENDAQAENDSEKENPQESQNDQTENDDQKKNQQETKNDQTENDAQKESQDEPTEQQEQEQSVEDKKDNEESLATSEVIANEPQTTPAVQLENLESTQSVNENADQAQVLSETTLSLEENIEASQSLLKNADATTEEFMDNKPTEVVGERPDTSSPLSLNSEQSEIETVTDLNTEEANENNKSIETTESSFVVDNDDDSEEITEGLITTPELHQEELNDKSDDQAFVYH